MPARDALQARLKVEQLEERNLPSVYTPAQISQAYGFSQVVFTTTSGQAVQGDGTGQTIAIVDAYSDPNIFSDLNTFDQTFTTTRNGATNTYYDLYGASSSFLTVATPQGQPATDAGWSLEITLDVEWAHAMAPGAQILLVEATSNNLGNLLGGVSYAAAQPGVVAVSMSWGSTEFSGQNTFDSYFTTPANHLGGWSGLGGTYIPGGITYVAASGDSGAGPTYPSSSPNVLSVGGTSLTLSASGGYGSETAWSGSGGGYSAYESEPGYQQGVQNTGTRGTPDVSYNADPYTGYWVYDSIGYGGYSGWLQVGGTSAAAPQWAALIAIADQGRALAGKGSLDGATQTIPAIYSLPQSDFHDITTGSNGYSAGPGWDPVTGRGTPLANLVIYGLAGFGSSTTPPPGGGGGSHHHHGRTHAARPHLLTLEGPAASVQPVAAGPLFVLPRAGPPLLPANPTVDALTIGTPAPSGAGPSPGVSHQGASVEDPLQGSGSLAVGSAEAPIAVVEPPQGLTSAEQGSGRWPDALDTWFTTDCRDREGPDAAEVATAPILAGEPEAMRKPAAVAAGVAVALTSRLGPPRPAQKPRRRWTPPKKG